MTQKLFKSMYLLIIIWEEISCLTLEKCKDAPPVMYVPSAAWRWWQPESLWLHLIMWCCSQNDTDFTSHAERMRPIALAIRQTCTVGLVMAKRKGCVYKVTAVDDDRDVRDMVTCARVYYLDSESQWGAQSFFQVSTENITMDKCHIVGTEKPILPS